MKKEILTYSAIILLAVATLLSSISDRKRYDEAMEVIESKLDAIASETDANNADVASKLDAIQADIDGVKQENAQVKEDFKAQIDEIKKNLQKKVDEINKEIEEVKEAKEKKRQEQIKAGIVAPDTTDGTYLGAYELTAYIETGNPCADGVYPTVNHTVACNDPNLWHRWVYIEGYGTYYVHDTGGMPSYNIIDVYVGDYNSAVQFGRRTANVYIVG